MNGSFNWGRLSESRFLSQHWQQKPVLLRQALPGFQPVLSRSELFALAAQGDVESRLIQHQSDGQAWDLSHGPFKPRQLPSPKTPNWTLLVQGVDLHSDAVSALMRSFRFIGEARMDDLMISYASPGGGVGPHLDNYDVFLLQAHGTREWRIGPVQRPVWRDGMPLKLLKHFVPTEVMTLHPGDVLYLPPGYGHDGVATSADCMTYSIGFRAPTQGELAQQLLQRHWDAMEADELAHGVRYGDAQLKPSRTPARVPKPLQAFALEAVQSMLSQPQAFHLALGEVLTEPKPRVWFEPPGQVKLGACRLDRRSRMLYDDTHVFLNGEAWRVKGSDAQVLRQLADQRHLSAAQVKGASAAVRSVLKDWLAQGWLVAGSA